MKALLWDFLASILVGGSLLTLSIPSARADSPSPSLQAEGDSGGDSGEDSGDSGEEEKKEEPSSSSSPGGTPETPPPTTPGPTRETSPPPPSDGGGSFFDDAPPPPDPMAEKLARRREIGRFMRERHQGFAIATFATLAAAEVFGTINAIQRHAGDGEVEYGQIVTHRVLVSATTGLYLTTGVLVWTAPKGLKRQGGGGPAAGHIDSSRVHRALSIGHGIGMATQLITGFLLGNVAGGDDYDALLAAHLISGYTTLGLMAASGIVITFF